MPLEGLRAWIGEVERKLGMRTRVFLVLAALALGGAGAAIYLALDTRDAAVSESDVRALQQDLETQIAGGAPASGTSLTDLEADLRELEAKVAALEGGTQGAGADSGATGAGTGAVPTPDTGGGIATEGAEAKDRLQKLLDEAETQNQPGEAAEAGGRGNAGG